MGMEMGLPLKAMSICVVCSLQEFSNFQEFSLQFSSKIQNSIIVSNCQNEFFNCEQIKESLLTCSKKEQLQRFPS